MPNWRAIYPDLIYEPESGKFYNKDGIYFIFPELPKSVEGYPIVDWKNFNGENMSKDDTKEVQVNVEVESAIVKDYLQEPHKERRVTPADFKLTASTQIARIKSGYEVRLY